MVVQLDSNCDRSMGLLELPGGDWSPTLIADPDLWIRVSEGRDRSANRQPSIALGFSGRSAGDTLSLCWESDTRVRGPAARPDCRCILHVASRRPVANPVALASVTRPHLESSLDRSRCQASRVRRVEPAPSRCSPLTGFSYARVERLPIGRVRCKLARGTARPSICCWPDRLRSSGPCHVARLPSEPARGRLVDLQATADKIA
jgi:hypothetical protein